MSTRVSMLQQKDGKKSQKRRRRLGNDSSSRSGNHSINLHSVAQSLLLSLSKYVTSCRPLSRHPFNHSHLSQLILPPPSTYPLHTPYLTTCSQGMSCHSSSRRHISTVIPQQRETIVIIQGSGVGELFLELGSSTPDRKISWTSHCFQCKTGLVPVENG